MNLLLKRFLPILTPIAVFILLLLGLSKPHSGWVYLLIIFFVSVASLVVMASQNSIKKTFHLLIPGFLFVLSFVAFIFSLSFSSSIFKYFFAALIAFVLAACLEINFNLFYKQKTTASFVNFFSCLNLLTAFMFYAALGALGVFLNLDNWILFIIAAIFNLIAFYNNYYAVSFLREHQKGDDLVNLLNQKIEILIGRDKTQRLAYTAVPALIILEVLWVLTFLPTSFYVNSFIITACFYVITGLTKNRLNNNLSKKIIRKYLLISGFCLLLIIFTARV